MPSTYIILVFYAYSGWIAFKNDALEALREWTNLIISTVRMLPKFVQKRILLKNLCASKTQPTNGLRGILLQNCPLFLSPNIQLGSMWWSRGGEVLGVLRRIIDYYSILCMTIDSNIEPSQISAHPKKTTRLGRCLKGIQAWIFLKYFFCRNRILMVPREFWKSYSIRPRYSNFKHFRVCSVSDEIIS